MKSRARGWALAATALLHGALLLGLVLTQPIAHRAVPPGVSVRLVAAPSSAAAMPQQPRLAAPVHLAMPATLVLPAPGWAAAAQEASPIAPAAPAAPLIAAMAPPTAGPVTSPPPAPEARYQAPYQATYQAAAPADRQCAADSAARHYPALLRERGIEGRVLLRVHVDEQGQATEVRVQDGSGYRLLDEAAQRVTQGCRFTPARRGEQPLASWVIYPVRFALN